MSVQKYFLNFLFPYSWLDFVLLWNTAFVGGIFLDSLLLVNL